MKPFDFKKEYKDLYAPKTTPEIITVPKANYIAVRGNGNPNEEGGAYKQAIGILFAVAYTIKMSYKSDYKMEGFYEYVVPPLEGLWWQEDADTVNYGDKDSFQWISLIRLPEFVTEKDFAWAVRNEYLKQTGYVEDISDERRHHEIYLTDARKTAPEKWKTVIRHPVRKEKGKNVNI